jgi:hypothetical protein
MWELNKKGGIRQLLIDQARSMSRPFEHDLMLAAPNIAERIKFISPALSEFNYPNDVALILERVSAVNESLNITHEVIEDHSHSITSGNPDVFGYMLRSDDNK